MADFKTHMGVSTATGALLAFAGYQGQMPLDTCLVAGTLCSVSGMLPDLDSNSGRPLREATALGAAVVPMLMVDRLQRLKLDPDTMVLIAIISYISIRFILAEIFRRYTVHRGMWHSIPAASICGMFAFLVMSHEDISVRLFKTTGVVLGFMSHLILDEIWSVDFRKGAYRFKESFGTALKLWGNGRVANVVTYAQALILGVLVWQDQGFMSRYQLNPNVPHTVSEMIASIRQRFNQATSSAKVEDQLLPEVQRHVSHTSAGQLSAPSAGTNIPANTQPVANPFINQFNQNQSVQGQPADNNLPPFGSR
jgi:membrane-bound metal-dependent hydrolase YbcI (DUF457 family)